MHAPPTTEAYRKSNPRPTPYRRGVSRRSVIDEANAKVSTLELAERLAGEQRIAREDGDGNATEVVVTPAGWSKATAAQLASLAAGATAGTATPEARDPSEDEGFVPDLTGIPEEDLIRYIEVDEKLRAAKLRSRR